MRQVAPKAGGPEVMSRSMCGHVSFVQKDVHPARARARVPMQLSAHHRSLL